MTQMSHFLQGEMQQMLQKYNSMVKIVEAVNPEKVLRQGYAILAGKVSQGSVVKITTHSAEVEAEFKKVKERK